MSETGSRGREQPFHPAEPVFDCLTGIAVIQTDHAGSIRYWSRGAEDLLGYTVSEVLHQPIDRIYPESARQRDVPEAERIILRHEGRFEELHWRLHRSGKPVAVHTVAQVAPLNDPVFPGGFLYVLRPVSPEQLEDDNSTGSRDEDPRNWHPPAD